MEKLRQQWFLAQQLNHSVGGFITPSGGYIVLDHSPPGSMLLSRDLVPGDTWPAWLFYTHLPEPARGGCPLPGRMSPPNGYNFLVSMRRGGPVCLWVAAQTGTWSITPIGRTDECSDSDTADALEVYYQLLKRAFIEGTSPFDDVDRQDEKCLADAYVALACRPDPAAVLPRSAAHAGRLALYLAAYNRARNRTVERALCLAQLEDARGGLRGGMFCQVAYASW